MTANRSASVLARLLNLAKQHGDDYNLLLNRFALERLLCRVAASIRDDNRYGGLRVRLNGRIDNARCALQIDVGFGDAVAPEPQAASPSDANAAWQARRLRWA